MMKVLFATDGSDQATTAFRTAARLLRREDSEFDLLCVAPEFYFPKGQDGKTAKKAAQMVEAYDRRIRTEARQHLTDAQTTLAALGVEAALRVEVGSPARVITRLAAEYDITLIGAHDQYTRSKPGLGPVASRVGAGRGVDRPRTRRGRQAMENPGGGRRIAGLRTGAGAYGLIASNRRGGNHSAERGGDAVGSPGTRPRVVRLPA
jgi:nucleotide-binding universal stress UspA family protein